MSSSDSENGNLTDLEEENLVNADSDTNESQQSADGPGSNVDDKEDDNEGAAGKDENPVTWEDLV